MKKLFIGLTVLCLLLSASTAFADNPIKIIIFGAEVKTDVSPIIQNGITLVPIRVVAEQLGYNVIYDEMNKAVKIDSREWTYKQYHDNTDFANDFEMTFRCLKEINNQIYEANLDNNQQESSTHLNMAKGWLSTAIKYNNNLNKYKTEDNVDELKILNETISNYKFYLDGGNAGFSIAQLYPKSHKNLEIWGQLDQYASVANVRLAKIEYETLPKLSR